MARLVPLVAALLVGCADDSTRLAGGTGSDLPRPTARLFDSAYKPIAAKFYRLWKLEGDSCVPRYQVSTTEGFVLPTEGSWIVEAWGDSGNVGAIEGLKKQRVPSDACLKTMARWITGEEGVGILSCVNLIDTTGHRRPLSMLRDHTPRPLAAGMFAANDAIRRYMRVPDGVQAFRFLAWKVLWEESKKPDMGATTQEVDSVLLRYGGPMVYTRSNVVDVTLPSGDWIIEGWTASIPDSEMTRWSTQQPAAKWADSSILRQCFDHNASDCGRPSRAPWIDGKAPDKIFSYRSP